MVLIKTIFYVNNLTPSFINTKYTIFRDTSWAYAHTHKHPVHLTLFASSFTNRESWFKFVNINFFFWRTLFFYLFLLVILVSVRGFFIWFNLIFISFSCFLLLLQFSFPRWTNNDFKFFLTLSPNSN